MIGLFWRPLSDISRQLTPLLLHWKIKIWFENSANSWGNYRILYHKTNKEASTELCSVVKHLGSVEHSRSGEKHSTGSHVFPYTSFVLYRFLRALQQNRAQSRLLYLLTQINARALIGQSAVDYCAGKPTEKSRVF